MRVLLTGASGFIGRHVAARLRERGHEVISVGRNAEGDVVLDLLDESAIARANLRADALLHLAWFAKPGEFWSSPENERWAGAGLALVRRFAEGGGTTVVVAGSCAEYGDGAERALRESDALAPSTRYGAAKAALFESLMSECGRDPRLRLAWARIFYPYGPGEPEEKLIPRLRREIGDGRVPELRTPDRLLDYIHVTDVAEGFSRILEGGVRGPINLGSGAGVSARQIAAALARRLRPELTSTIATLVGTSPPALPIIADVTRMHAELGSWAMLTTP